MKKIHYTASYILNPVHPVSVHLIGCGGTGSFVLTSLARIDHALKAIGNLGLHVTVYDPDVVSEANIARQLFSPCDLGVNKAVTLVSRLNTFFGLSWEARNERYSTLLEECVANITISCVDTVNSRLEITKKLHSARNGFDDREGFYWMDFGNTKDSGQVVLGTLKDVRQPKSENYITVAHLDTITDMWDLSLVNEEESGPSCSLAEAIKKQDLFINSTLAQLGADLLWKLFSRGKLDMHGLFLNLERMVVNPIRL